MKMTQVLYNRYFLEMFDLNNYLTEINQINQQSNSYFHYFCVYKILNIINMKNLIKIILISVFTGLFFINGIAQTQEIPKASKKDNTFIVNVDFHCGGGKSRLESGLSKIEGVQEVVADLETKNVTIKHNSKTVTTEELVLAIEKIGHRTEYTPEDRKVKSACTHKH